MFKKLKKPSIKIEMIEYGKFLVFNNMNNQIKTSSYIEERNNLKKEVNKMIDDLFEEKD